MTPWKCFGRSVLVGALWLAASTASFAQTAVRSLAGDWRFALDRTDAGMNEKWFTRDLTDKIKLPGVLQGQGYGDEISTSTPWVTTLGDAWWKLQPAALRDRFSQPGKTEVPFIAQPPRHYLGAAWYQRDIDIPNNWQGRHIVLFLERPHWETTVWVDDKAYPSNKSLVAPHVSDLGTLTPGKHRLSIRIDNRQVVRDPANDGHGVDSHSVSDSLGATWNGIAGRIELSASTPVWIEDAQVYPSVAKKTALVKVAIGNATGQAGSGILTAGKSSAPVSWTATGGTAEIEVQLGANAKTWDEFHPELQHLTVTLKGGGSDDSKALTFGLREVTHDDKKLLVNGHIVNLRTTHSGGDFPLTGYPATDVGSWKKIFQVCQDYGLNGMRFHSWCPPEAAFTAADEMGFYLQPECGMWSPFNPGSVYTVFLEEETARLLKAFGNHPSFLLLSPSNEPAGRYPQVTPKWAADWYQKDNRRLYSAGTGWADPSQVNGGPQYAALVRFGRGELRNTAGWFGKDFRAALDNVHIPVLAHEVGQWCAYPDFDVIKEFTGYLRPSNYDIFKYIAEQQGLLAQNHELAYASGRFQLMCYKEEIEANLRTPDLSGYQLLDLHDYLGQGTALIGLVDAFWKPKSYVTAKEFRRFNSETVPLARLAKRVFTTAETLTSDVELYHFAEKPLTQAKPYWKVVDASGKSVTEGQWPARDLPIGKNLPLGQVAVDLSRLPAPAAYKLVVGLQGTSVANDWNFWLYPAQVEPTVPSGVLLTDNWAEASARLAAGGKVVFTPKASELDAAKCPPMKNVPVFWNIQMTVRPPRNPTARFDGMLGLLCDPKSPALAGFPTEVNCDWQWTPLIHDVRSINLDRVSRDLKPIVSTIDDWNRDWRLGVIFECKVGTGSLLVSALPLQDPKASIGLQQLRRSLLDYAASNRFRPSVALSTSDLASLWPGSSSAPAAGPRALDPDLDDGSGRPAQKKG
jgi:hypothetical protein